MARQDDCILETVWEGKYDSQGQRRRFSPPHHNHALELFEHYGQEKQPQELTHRGNTLVLGENLELATSLLKAFAGKVKLIYLDPPFNIGKVHQGRILLESGVSLFDQRGYDDRWGKDQESFSYFLWQRLQLAHKLLSEEGSIFLHCNDASSALVKALLDDIFGAEHFQNQIIWHYTGGGRSRSRLSNKHDLIYWYSKTKSFTFNIDALRKPYKPTSGYARSGIRAASGKHYLPHPKGSPVDDVWEIPILNPQSHERSGYPTQKPLKLLKQILSMASNSGDLVADFFGGSGTTALAAAELKRNFLHLDRSPFSLHITRKRLLHAGFDFSFFVQRSDEKPQKTPGEEASYRASPELQILRKGAHVQLLAFNAILAGKNSVSQEKLKAKGLELVDAWAFQTKSSQEKETNLMLASSQRMRGKHHFRTEFKLPQKAQDIPLELHLYDVFGGIWLAHIKLEDGKSAGYQLQALNS